MRTPLVAANWKMHKTVQEAQAFLQVFRGLTEDVTGVDIVIAPPFTALTAVVAGVQGSSIAVAGQDAYWQAEGAFTGAISPSLLAHTGATHVILGHSERRQYHGETSAEVAAKAAAVHAAGLKAIICIGETDAEREAGKADSIVVEQLQQSLPDSATAENTAIAYEPVWAIGTGKTASTDDIKHMHALIRTKSSEKIKNGAWLRLLYGGSVKPGNAAEILHLPNVDGVLVGGASLKPEDFWGIAQASQA